MKVETILVISNKGDITTDLVIKKLQEKEINYIRFNTEDFPLKYKSQISIYSNANSFLESNKGYFSFDEIKSIWYRRPKLSDLSNLDASENDKNFILREANSFLFNLWSFLSDKFWVNDPFSLYKAERKAYQLIIAKKVGLNIPETIISNNFDDVNHFIKIFNNKVIVKPISHGGYGNDNDYAIFTIDLENKNYELEKNIVGLSPFILQRKIEKKYDVRVSIFGQKIFAHKILLNKPDIEIDWRVYKPAELSYLLIPLPNDLIVKILNLMSYLNLKYGALDFIVDNSDIWHFIEINPNGQFAWLEVSTGDKLINSLINLLFNYEN